MSKMLRIPSHASSSNSASSPKSSRSRFFFKKERGQSTSTNISQSDIGSGDSNKEFEPNHSEDKILSSPFQLPDIESSRSNGFPTPDPFIAATHDKEYLHLKENIRRIRKAPSGTDPKKVDNVWEVYKKVREECLQLCQSLLQKSQNTGRNASIDTNIGPLDHRSSHSGSLTETSLPFHVNDQWLAAIQEYKATQEQMLENLTNSLLITYKSYEPNLSERQIQAFLSDKVLRKNMILKWRDTSVHAMKSEKLLFWDQYKIRSLNLDRLKLDLQATEKLFDMAETGSSDDMMIKEYVIAKNGDTILEFPNKVSEIHPVLRFRVSSHLLAESSQFFSHIFSSQQAGNNTPIDMMGQVPPLPSRQTCKDGMEVKVYRMPQLELNKNEALTILLHAAHMHHAKVPREIEFPVFVSIAEVCLRYQCTSPLELQVEYQWLPQWLHRAADQDPDGFLLISYAFGIRRIFTRVSKTAILNALSDTEIQGKELWPQPVRDKIKAIRAAKLDQIHECCTNAIEEYFRPPLDNVDRRASVGSLVLTTMPRCPKGAHLCDATNLGWLMLVFNELRTLPSIMNNTGFHNLPTSPQRSLKELVDCLRLMPSAPQVHSGVCDYAPAFRSAINDIYNSISGLTLRDVTGRNGWALSKHAGPTEDRYDDVQDVSELEAPSHPPGRLKRFGALSNENVSFRILSYIDDPDDLSSAAMIDKSFYSAYKRNEALLLRNVMKAERRRTLSQVGPELVGVRNATRPSVVDSTRFSVSTKTSNEESRYLTVDKTKRRSRPQLDTPSDDLYDVSPPVSPLTTNDTPMSAEEAEKILWPNDDPIVNSPSRDTNTAGHEKFLMGDITHVGGRPSPLQRGFSRVENKTRVMADEKHLREEKERVLGPVSPPTPDQGEFSATSQEGPEQRPYNSKNYI